MEKSNSGRIRKFNLTVSRKHQRPGTEKNIVIIVALTALIFVAASAVMSQWYIEKMSKIVRRQFNEEQMVIAHNVKNFIEREFSFLKREINILSNELEKNEDPDSAMKASLARVIECGVSKIEFRDMNVGVVYSGHPFRKEISRSPLEEIPPLLLDFGAKKINQLEVSKHQITPSGIVLTIVAPVGVDGSRIISCRVNISWLLGPYLKNIRSGQTGYAWIIDGAGRFLFHPDSSYIGKNAFLARREKYQDISFVEINKIQKDKMLKGHEGTGRYVSGWHRGLTGRMEKLIAYTSVTISKIPAQKWSVAVVAPVSEIEEAVRNQYRHQFFMQLAVIFTIIAGASIILFFEVKWSRHMEKEVNRQTEELVESEAKYRSLVESAEDFIFTIDPNGKFQSMNSFTSSFFKCRTEDHIGKGLPSLFPKEMSQSLQPLIRRVFENGKSIRKEFGFSLERVQIFIDANMVPVRSEKRGVNSVLCIARDITEDKKLERHLIHTEKLASLGTLAAGVAHEINNPLGVILGFCDLILRKKDKSSQDYKDLKIMERQGLHCKEIVENLLGFVRTGEDNGHHHTDLNLCLEAAIKIVRHRFEKEGISLSTEFSDTIPLVKGDSRKLQQVFLNLINNAADAMLEGGKLTIRTFMDTHLHMVTVQFQDEGIAIEGKDIGHIFEPFFTTKPEGRGTGLGLFVSYGIITGFGGIMECESWKHPSGDAASGGTIFTVKLMVIS
ncbi:sensor histidine kinase [Desulfobacula sp.]|uniref:sensor histidine kinase n=1 Tax=Desulfobacula sp. TaxID=2593537 RepID=UPI0025BF9A26|nr:sensor histidine kinase [Desulfobacula sp.]MBC2703175.1 PAS domain S-box protein [Desulfobacula sp.]